MPRLAAIHQNTTAACITSSSSQKWIRNLSKGEQGRGSEGTLCDGAGEGRPAARGPRRAHPAPAEDGPGRAGLTWGSR